MTRTFEFHQGDYNLRFSAGGICATLSAAWIRMMRDEKDHGPGYRKAELVSAINHYGPIVQKYFGKGWGSQGAEEALSYVLRLAGDSESEEFYTLNGLPAMDVLTKYVADKRQQGVHFSFWWPEGADEPGHSVAFWRSGVSTWHASGHVYFFDPNEGEYKGNKGEVPTWLRKFLGGYSNAFTSSILVLAKPVSKLALVGAKRVM